MFSLGLNITHYILVNIQNIKYFYFELQETNKDNLNKVVNTVPRKRQNDRR